MRITEELRERRFAAEYVSFMRGAYHDAQEEAKQAWLRSERRGAERFDNRAQEILKMIDEGRAL